MRQPSSVSRPTTIVFDVGGVLLDWNPRHLYRKIFSDTEDMEWFLANVCTPEWNAAQDQGRAWHVAEAEAIARHPSHADSIHAFRARWHEMIPSPIDGTVAILENLARQGVPLYAITNFASETFRETTARFAFFRHFRGIVVSGDIGMLKPDPAIYQRLANDHGVDLTHAVFIDDVAHNVAAAHALGMTAITFSDARQLGTSLVALGFDCV